MPFSEKQIGTVQELERISQLTKVDKKKMKELTEQIKSLEHEIEELEFSKELVDAQNKHKEKAKEIMSLKQMNSIKDTIAALSRQSGQDEQIRSLKAELKIAEENFTREMSTPAGLAFRESQIALQKIKGKFDTSDIPEKRRKIRQRIGNLEEELDLMKRTEALHAEVIKRCLRELRKLPEFSKDSSASSPWPESVLTPAITYSLIKLTGDQDAAKKKLVKNQCKAVGWKADPTLSKAITTAPDAYKATGLDMEKINEVVFLEYKKILKERIENTSRATLEGGEQHQIDRKKEAEGPGAKLLTTAFSGMQSGSTSASSASAPPPHPIEPDVEVRPEEQLSRKPTS